MIKRKLSQFNFDLPEELLANRPAENRDESRLMIIDRKTGKFEHKIFKDLINFFDDGDVMIFNNTKVFPARMYGNKEKNRCSYRGVFTSRIEQRQPFMGRFG